MELSGVNAEYTHHYNKRVVLEAIRVLGPISRTEIARLTSLMFQTVSTITRGYCEQGIVSEVGRRQSSRGQPATLLALNTDIAYTLGIHIDRKQICVVLVDLAGKVIAQHMVSTNGAGPNDAFAHIARMADAIVARSGVSERKIIAAGIALPGPLQGEGLGTAAPNFPGWADVDVREQLEVLLGRPVYVERDAVAAAIGERLHGESLAVRNFAYVFFGYGLGAGLILNHQPYRGQWGHAGEIGHLMAVPLGSPHDGVDYRYLEDLISIDRLASLLDLPEGSTQMAARVTACLDAGDARINAWLDEVATYVTPAFIAMENLLDVERIVVGGVMQRPYFDALVQRIAQRMARARMPGKRPYSTICVAGSGENAAALGAAAMPVFEALAPNPAQMLKQSDGRRLDVSGPGFDRFLENATMARGARPGSTLGPKEERTGSQS